MSYTTKEIIELMEKAAQLNVSVEIAENDFAVKIDGKEERIYAAPVAEIPAALPGTTNIQATVINPTPEPQAEPKGTVVKSPIVGTYYASPAPDKDPFVKVGQKVKKGEVLFIIESMKLMNEVTSDYDGVVKEILVGNGQAVEFGQPVLVLE
ncbi:acetyl-CoA carboxylase biotin carboxyl carrier protein [Hydrogenoanaerobacterium sp.]|uniref:acetyl-CoA carboxylase biotin carboxyl carrier protein n=1 Tax=Hydrogenoanaerobacterium sp. TaxID=2953763 RepID=UPI002897F1E4|nr:acetyl-CoA carboxylase biotin carboxyl carrier protein [Hydrogenoanaerobacterium sp.]